MRYLLTLILIILMLGGCSPKKAIAPDERGMQAVTEPYAFITGLTSGTSWGDVRYNGAKIGWGTTPVIAGGYVWYIKYQGTYPNLKTEPVKYNIATGAVTSLGTASTSIMSLWNKIDATDNGTYLVGSFTKTTVKRNGSTTTIYYANNAELSDDGNWVFYVKNDKAYRMNLNTKAISVICANGYVAEVATNKDGSMAIVATWNAGKYDLYKWNGSLTCLGTGYAYYNGVDMNVEGVFCYSVNGKVYWWDGVQKIIGTGVFPAINNDGVLFGNNGNLCYYDLGDSTGEILGTYGTAVMFCSW